MHKKTKEDIIKKIISPQRMHIPITKFTRGYFLHIQPATTTCKGGDDDNS